MSKVSLYESNWINLVFENRNKKYGAFQLRKESTKTSMFALFIGLLLCTFLMSIPRITSLISPEEKSVNTLPVLTNKIIEVKNIYPNQTAKPKKQAQAKAIDQQPIEKIKSTKKKQLINPVIVQAELSTPDSQINLNNGVSSDSTTDGTSTGSNASSGQGDFGIGTGLGTGTDYGNALVNTELLDKKPEFPGGIGKFYKYVASKFASPVINDEKIVRIYVSFVVEKDGTMSNFQVINNPGYGLDKEAIRVLKSLRTKWSPGMVGSKPVRTAYRLPISVQIY